MREQKIYGSLIECYPYVIIRFVGIVVSNLFILYPSTIAQYRKMHA